MFFSCAALGTLCANLVSRLAAGEAPARLDLPAEAAQVDYQAVLRQAQIYWSAPPKRLLTRRRNNYPVQICTDFDSLWHQLNGDREGVGPELTFATSDWMVINESPGGYAVMNVAGGVNGVQSGGILGLRPGPDQPWSLCLVRWARSDNPEHLELGLELVAPSAQAVRVASRRTGQPLPALLLPSLSRLDRGESLLAPRGTYANTGFTLLQDIDGRLRIAYCLPGGLWLQTSLVEVYEFERDPLPL